MDELDQRILNELQRGGIQKSAALASILGASQRTIHRRLRTMIDKEMIKVIAVLNPVSLAYRGWARIGIKVARGALGRVSGILIKNPSIHFVAYSFGGFDIIIGVYFNTVEKLTQFVNSELTKDKDIVSSETMLLSCPRKYYHFSWPPCTFKGTENLWNPYQETNARRCYTGDELDQRILKVLVEDGLTSTRDLKLRLGIGELTIRKRIRSMLDNEVYKLEVVPNTQLLESERWATTGIVANSPFLNRTMEDIVKNPAVYLASESLGRFNIIIATRFRNTNQLSQFIHRELQSMPGINSTETFIHVRPLKYHNIIWPGFES